MTKAFYINDKGFDEKIDDFINFMNENLEHEKIIFLYSGGGFVTNLTIYETLINRCGDKVTLVANQFVGSCALELLLWTRCKEKIIEDNTIGFFHHTGASYYFRGGELENENDKMDFKQFKKMKATEWEKMQSLGLTDKEKSQYKRHKHITFNDARLRELINLTNKKDANTSTEIN